MNSPLLTRSPLLQQNTPDCEGVSLPLEALPFPGLVLSLLQMLSSLSVERDSCQFPLRVLARPQLLFWAIPKYLGAPNHISPDHSWRRSHLVRARQTAHPSTEGYLDSRGLEAS